MLQIRVAGPGLDVSCTLRPGEPELVLGRDAGCAVCLPDPQRNVSRRHLAVWNEAGELHFRVLSAVNGVEMPFGEAPPGARGVLPAGQQLRIADYVLSAQSASAPGETDPWAVFDNEGSGTVARPATRAFMAAALTGGFKVPSPEEDPFGDWGFETTFGPGSTAGELPGAGGAAAQGSDPRLLGLLRGLGLPDSDAQHLSERDLETFGRCVREALLGIVEQHRQVAGTRRELHAEDRTMLAAQDENPLRAPWPPQTLLRYLLSGGAGFMPPEAALRELLEAHAAHQAALAAATRSAVEGVLREFAPATLRDRLLGAGGKLFEGARAWEAFGKDYTEQAAVWAQWVDRLLDKYFTETYVREVQEAARKRPPSLE